MWQLRKDRLCTETRPWFYICAGLLHLLIMASKVCLSNGDNTLSPGQSLSSSQVIVSSNNLFELGFFTTGKPVPNMYLGIWYKDFPKNTVWVLNRNNPLFNSSKNSAKLEFSQDFNLVLLNESETIWSTKLTMPSSVEAVLRDDGNFVLCDSSKPSAIFWQSFDYPTDTWLPGAKLGTRNLLTSWKNSVDPSAGLFSAKIDTDGKKEFQLEWNMSRTYWSSGNLYNKMFSNVVDMLYLYDFTFVSNEKEAYFTYTVLNPAAISRLVIDVAGQLRQISWRHGLKGVLRETLPKEQSEVYAFCGPYGIFNKNLSALCACLPGFKQPFSTETMILNNWPDGCVRKIPLKCENSTSSNGQNDKFKKIPNVNLPDISKAYPAQSIRKCELACMQNCFCIAYTYSNIGCLVWNGTLLNLKQLSNADNDKHDLYIKLAGSEFQRGGGNRTIWWIVTAVLVSLVVLVAGGLLCCFRMRKRKQTRKKDLSKDLLSYDFNSSSNATEEERDQNNPTLGENKDIELPLFNFESVSAATDDFSENNKLGQGGFGQVYKGKSLGGQEIALKRLSKRSGQGLEEFRNEIILISKLQHRNLVKLLGCCIEQDENILIYEYMPNKSLDFFLFDPNKQEQLNWETRIQIIEGIAQGLLYLHKYSRLRIIHRDLKASNILLDSEMNPKISDFGMARIFSGGNDSQANTKRVVGTFGYMAPEYVLEGHFSTKSDVFSFGVLLLEILSGRKNTGFYNSDSLSLLGHAWELWNADRTMELMDPVLRSPSSVSTLLRYVNIGLLCVQGKPSDRPSMSKIISMLSNELVPLAIPKEPAFTTSHVPTKSNASLSIEGNCSVNGLTISRIEPR